MSCSLHKDVGNGTLITDYLQLERVMNERLSVSVISDEMELEDEMRVWPSHLRLACGLLRLSGGCVRDPRLLF